jgi:folylpolyglutamate synthase/dihydropteroate synthase
VNVDISRAAIRLLTSDRMHAAHHVCRHSHRLKGLLRERLLDSGNAAHIVTGLAKRPPCRFEIFPQTQTQTLTQTLTQTQTQTQARITTTKKINVVLDIAHNMDAIKSLVRKVKSVYGDRHTPIR